MSFTRSLLLCCTILAGTAAMALAGGGGSTYSVLGLGDLRYLPGARGAGMGYTGIGLPGSLFINPTAPATWSQITRTRVDASLLYEGFSTSDGRISRYLAETNFAGALLAIPVSPVDGFVVVAGFTPYSNVSYNLSKAGTYQTATDTLNYASRSVGTGGLGQAELGLSWAPFNQLALGASVNYVFGTINRALTMTTSQTGFAVGSSLQTEAMRGLLVNVGALYSGFRGVFRPLSLGVNITTPGTLNSSREKTFTYSGGNQVLPSFDTLQLASGKVKIPLALGFGLSWAVSDRAVFAADYRTQAWGSSEFYGTPPEGIRNSSMAGIGFERMASRDPSASFGNHLSYRLGFMYNSTYYEVKGVPINEWLGTGGVSLPISADARLNLSAEYGVRGSRTNSLVRDSVFRFTISVTLGEMWFVRPEEE